MTEKNTGFKGLGIEPTGDTRAVKRAYAAILKTIDLEKDPALFAQLRSDYQAAIDWADASNNIAATPPAPDTDAEGAGIALTGVSRDAQVHTPFNGTSEGIDAFSDGDLSSASRPAPAVRHGLSAPTAARRADAALPAGLNDSDQAERAAIGLLLDPNTPHRDRVLEEGLRRFGWDMLSTGATTDLDLFGNVRGWFMLLLLERRRWHDLKSKERLRIETLIARIASRAPSGAMDAVNTWEALAATVESFPLWTALVGSAAQIEHWQLAWAAVPQWKRKLLLHRKTLTIGSVGGLVLVAIVAVAARTLDNDSAPDWAVALANFAVTFTAICAMLLVFVLMVGKITKSGLVRLRAGKPDPQPVPPFVMNIKKRAGIIIVAVPLFLIFTAFVIDLVLPVIGPRQTVMVVIGTGIAICVLVAKVRALWERLRR